MKSSRYLALAIVFLVFCIFLSTAPIAEAELLYKESLAEMPHHLEELVFSPDGRDLYGARPNRFRNNEPAIQWAHLRRDEQGALTMESEVWMDGFERFPYVLSTAMGPNGRFVYLLVGDGELLASSIFVFERDAETGHLSLRQRIEEGLVEPGFSFTVPRGTILISEDGDSAFLAGAEIMTFDRNALNGELSNPTLVPDSEGVQHITLSADERVLVATGSVALRSWLRTADGTLEPVSSLTELVSGTRTLDRGRYILTAPSGELYWWARDSSDIFPGKYLLRLTVDPDGTLVPVGEALTAFGCCDSELLDLAVDPLSHTLFAGMWDTNGSAGFITPFRPESDSFVKLPSFSGREGANTFGEGPGHLPSEIIFAPSGGHFYIRGYGREPMALFNVDAGGEVEAVPFANFEIEGLLGLREFWSADQGRELFLASDAALSLWRQGSEGWKEVSTLRLETDDFQHFGLRTAEPIGDDLILGILSRAIFGPAKPILIRRDSNPSEGESLQVVASPDLEWQIDSIDLPPITLAISQDKEIAYVGVGRSIEVLRFDLELGLLQPVATLPFDDLITRRVVLSGDGSYLYAIGETSDASSIRYEIDPTTGIPQAGMALPTFVNGAADFALSPDDEFAYLLRSEGSGTIDLEVYKLDGIAFQHLQTIPGFDGREARLALSSGGRRLAATFEQANALIHFRRDPSSGLLTELDRRLGSETASPSALREPFFATYAANGNELWVGSRQASSLAFYERDCLDEDQDALCLGVDRRFRVEIDWEARRSDGRALPGIGRRVEGSSGDSGLLWFFDSDNWEVMVKVLDGCGLNSRFWILTAGTTNVAYDLRVTDRTTGEQRIYSNLAGSSAPSLLDTDAFATCDVSSGD